MSSVPPARTERGQSNVVGALLLLGLTLLSLGAITVGVSEIVDRQATNADVSRVADGLDSTLRPAETTGVRTGSVAVGRGRFRLDERDVRVWRDGVRVVDQSANALTFETGDRAVTFLAGALVLRGPGWARLYRPPGIATGSDVLVVGLPVTTGDVSLGVDGGVRVDLRVEVTHDRRDLGTGRYRLAVETETRDLDGDGVPSVVAYFEGERAGYVVLHRMAVTLR